MSVHRSLPIENKIDPYRFLGLPHDASPEEIERRCEVLLDWLDPDDVPGDLRAWALNLRALTQGIYENLDLPGEEDVEVEVEGPGLQARPARERTGVGRGRRSFLPGLAGNPLALVTIGVVVGLVAVLALWQGGVIFNEEEETPTQEQQETFTPSTYLESHQERITELKQMVADNPADTAALFELGETYIVGEAWEETIYWFTKLLEMDPNNTHAHMDIGTAAMSLGRYTQAEAAFSEVLGLEPENAQAHYNIGFLFAFRTDEEQDLEEAVKHWQEVIRLAPDSELASVAQVHIDQYQTPGIAP